MNKKDRDILDIAIPSIVSNITVPLLGLVDVTIVGHMGNAAYIAAIAVGSMIFNVIYWIFGFLRMGTSGMTSQAYGRQRLDEAVDLLVRSLAVGVGIGLAFVAGQSVLKWAALELMQPTADIAVFTSTYFDICIWGAPAVLGLYSLTGWYIGMQNTRLPMLVSIFQNVVNIAASLVFVYLFGMKVEGVAFGTLTAQYAGFLAAFLFLRKRYREVLVHVSLRALRDAAAMMRFFTVNRDIFLRTLFLVAVNLFFTAAGAKQGAVVLSVNTLLFQLFTLYSYVMDGFAYAGEAIGGKYFGARNQEAFDDTVSRLFRWGLALTLFYTFLYLVAGEPFLRLLTDEPEVVDCSKEYILWAVAIPLAGMGAFYWDGLYIGMTATRGMLSSTFTGAAVFFTVHFSLFPLLGNHALWLALILYLVSRGVVQTVLFRRYRNG
ncbi:MAG: MATE family efflux transporter [Prevotellaceae bacterium]|nr:MATE family efflux transporter [Prevotellaceae bacterium]